MSRVVNCSNPDDCKPWQAPNLGSTNDNNYDYKLDNGNSFTSREQQEKIRQQSYEKSFAKGYMEGIEKGQKEIQGQVHKLQMLMAALSVPLPELDNQVVDELVQLCIAMVKQMIRRELKMSPGEIVAVVRESLNMLPATATEIILELHPEDAKLIRDAVVQPGAEANWRIVEDSFISRGGCRVLTGQSRIDATVEKRINAVIAEVLGSERKADAEDDE